MNTKERTLEEAMLNLFEDLGWVGTRTTTELNQNIKDQGAVIRVSELHGGEVTRTQRIVRLRVEVYTVKYDAAWDRANTMRDRMRATPFWSGGWLVDRSTVESDFAESFFADGLRYLSAIFRVTTRS